MIRLEQVTKEYKNQKAVAGISLHIKEGETLVLLGTSGCGKTTTLRMINRLIKPSSGTVWFDNKNIEDVKPETLRLQMGYVLQHIGLFPHYTIAENIAIVPKLLHWNKKQIAQRTIELLQKLHLPESISNAYPATLSGGQQQRVGLARALAANPSVLLMDEPLGALDPMTRDSIRQEFLQLDELKKKTIVMVTHDVQEAFEMADKICLMNNGKIEQVGTAKDLLFNPATEFVKSFFSQHQLQLEMQALQLSDVWTIIGHDSVDDNAIGIPMETSIWKAMELISATDDSGNKKWFGIHQDEKKEISLPGLMKAFTALKQANHE